MCTFSQSQLLTNTAPGAAPLEKHLLYSPTALAGYLITSYLNHIPTMEMESGWVETVSYPVEGMNLSVGEKK